LKTLSRQQFIDAIEAAVTHAGWSPVLAAPLRRAAFTATESETGSFDRCPLTIAGLTNEMGDARDSRLRSGLDRFWQLFDAAAREYMDGFGGRFAVPDPVRVTAMRDYVVRALLADALHFENVGDTAALRVYDAVQPGAFFAYGAMQLYGCGCPAVVGDLDGVQQSMVGGVFDSNLAQALYGSRPNVLGTGIIEVT
jgi:hypothetical protein